MVDPVTLAHALDGVLDGGELGLVVRAARGAEVAEVPAYQDDSSAVRGTFSKVADEVLRSMTAGSRTPAEALSGRLVAAVQPIPELSAAVVVAPRDPFVDSSDIDEVIVGRAAVRIPMWSAAKPKMRSPTWAVVRIIGLQMASVRRPSWTQGAWRTSVVSL